MLKVSSKINKLVMRRIWYVFLLSIFINRGTIAGLTLGVSLGAFFKLVYVRAIISNLMHTEVGQVPLYIWKALRNNFTNGEVLQLSLLFLIIVSSVYLAQLLVDLFSRSRGEWRSA
jgi:large-conductance mechanosensitive channel